MKIKLEVTVCEEMKAEGLTKLDNGKQMPILKDGKQTKVCEVIGSIPVLDDFNNPTGKENKYAVKFWNEKADAAIKAFTIGSKVQIIAYIDSRQWKDESTGKTGYNTNLNGYSFNVLKQ